MRNALKVKIPQRFKKKLTLRFSPREKGYGEIHVAVCPLCKEYKEVDYCGVCPFGRFEMTWETMGFFDDVHDVLLGCEVWIHDVIKDYPLFSTDGMSHIIWASKDREKVMKQLRLLRKRAKGLIEWV